MGNEYLNIDLLTASERAMRGYILLPFWAGGFLAFGRTELGMAVQDTRAG